MQLVDDEDVETMITLYYSNWSGQITPIQLFAKLADVELTEDFIPFNYSDPNLNKVLDDIDDEDTNDDENVNASSLRNHLI
ncbi:hypothetical protein GOBAR_AA34140 [Gossypium barbadense]|uniref:Uncharacterized protein n=1 Tax=Gossypium barbadense TaxID=3634 RepID=A0A2P5W657_GOSBA|nr:hypothetical protein GOBAR_AA34140 [Gossypium barbadense]